jgi:hypothetical protein
MVKSIMIICNWYDNLHPKGYYEYTVTFDRNQLKDVLFSDLIKSINSYKDVLKIKNDLIINRLQGEKGIYVTLHGTKESYDKIKSFINKSVFKIKESVKEDNNIDVEIKNKNEDYLIYSYIESVLQKFQSLTYRLEENKIHFISPDKVDLSQPDISVYWNTEKNVFFNSKEVFSDKIEMIKKDEEKPQILAYLKNEFINFLHSNINDGEIIFKIDGLLYPYKVNIGSENYVLLKKCNNLKEAQNEIKKLKYYNINLPNQIQEHKGSNAVYYILGTLALMIVLLIIALFLLFDRRKDIIAYMLALNSVFSLIYITYFGITLQYILLMVILNILSSIKIWVNKKFPDFKVDFLVYFFCSLWGLKFFLKVLRFILYNRLAIRFMIDYPLSYLFDGNFLIFTLMVITEYFVRI